MQLFSSVYSAGSWGRLYRSSGEAASLKEQPETSRQAASMAPDTIHLFHPPPMAVPPFFRLYGIAYDDFYIISRFLGFG